MEDALIEVTTMRRFAGIALITDRIPDEYTILAFRDICLRSTISGGQIFEAVKDHLKAIGMAVKQVTILDATIINAPSSAHQGVIRSIVRDSVE
jgi:IS5 family transposase